LVEANGSLSSEPRRLLGGGTDRTTYTTASTLLTPSSTTLVRSCIVLVTIFETVLAEATSDGVTRDHQQETPLGLRALLRLESYAGRELPGWVRYLDTDQLGSLVLVALPLLLLLLTFVLIYKLSGGSGASRTHRTKGLKSLMVAMAVSTFTAALLLTGLRLLASPSQHGQATASWTPGKTAQTTGEAPVFTIPASADVGKNILPNINDPEAVDPQMVCPGYRASNVQVTESGFTAYLDLAGAACNVYGNDVEHLTLDVEFQADDRLHVEIRPRYISPENETWFILPEELVPRLSSEDHHSDSNLVVSWSNDPTFSFTVERKDTRDTLFSTQGKVLVYEDQFIEFVSALPEHYNLYGLGEVFHGFRLGNNLTSEFIIPHHHDNGAVLINQP
jgi:alpha-glucosidase